MSKGPSNSRRKTETQVLESDFQTPTFTADRPVNALTQNEHHWQRVSSELLPAPVSKETQEGRG